MDVKNAAGNYFMVPRLLSDSEQARIRGIAAYKPPEIECFEVQPQQ